MPLDDYDFSKRGKRWVSYFDRLGFGSFTVEHDLEEIFSEISFCLTEARRQESSSLNTLRTLTEWLVYDLYGMTEDEIKIVEGTI
jgi:thermostable 8-oxoguanine DNA glycosylase